MTIFETADDMFGKADIVAVSLPTVLRCVAPK